MYTSTVKSRLSFIFLFALLYHFFCTSLFATDKEGSLSEPVLWQLQNAPQIIPKPKEVKYEDKYIEIISRNGTKKLAIAARTTEEQKAARIFNRQMKRSGIREFEIYTGLNTVPDSFAIILVLRISDEFKRKTSQAYSINFKFEENKNLIYGQGFDLKGCIYAATSLAQLVTLNNGQTLIRNAEIFDYPDYSRRIYHGLVDAQNLSGILDWMVRYKMECLVIDNRNYSWWKLDAELKKIFDEFNRWQTEFGGVTLMQPHNIYQGREIEISNRDHINALKHNIRAGLESGITRLIILADDTPPFKFGDGYVLTSDRDKERFTHMAEAHCFLMSEIRSFIDSLNYQCELYYVPAFYTYEEMHYGDMELYLNTPWQKQAFDPLYRDLAYIGKNMPDDIQIIWSGPKVRSRIITNTDFEDWTNNLNGRTPFLWDNTIYSHYPFTSTAMITAFDNDFPEQFYNKTAGNGMFINGNIADELSRPSAMTVNEFLWNSENYRPEPALKKTLMHLYGQDAVDYLINFRNTELEIRQLTGAHKLWYQADTLWSVIRKIRFTTEKNPFYYHLNYSRLKALRLQLKNSVAGPLTPEEYNNKINSLYQEREKILHYFKDKNRPDLLKNLELNCTEFY